MRKGITSVLVVALLAAGGLSSAFGAGQPDEDVITAYTAHEESIIEAMVSLWEDTYPDIELDVIRMGSGEVISRVRAEENRPQGDVIWSIGGEPLEENSDLLADYQPAEWDQIEDLYKVGTNWIPYTGIMNVFMVNTDMLSEADYPRSWPDLANIAEGRVSKARADQSGSAYMQLANVIAIYGEDEGWSIFEDIMGNLALQGSSGAVPRIVADGEFPVAVTLEDNAHRYVEGGAPVEIVYPEDGVVAAPDGVAKIAGAPNAEGAELFLDWVTSTEVQNFLVEEMGRRPVHSGADTPEGLPPLSEIETVDYDFGWSAANRDDYIDRFTELMMEMDL